MIFFLAIVSKRFNFSMPIIQRDQSLFDLLVFPTYGIRVSHV